MIEVGSPFAHAAHCLAAKISCLPFPMQPMVSNHSLPPKLARMPYMCAEQLEWFARHLDAKLAGLERQMDSIKAMLNEGTEQQDDEVGRAAREELCAAARADELRLTVERQRCTRALAAIATGEYGWCHNTGEEIGLGRLQARPDALLCIAEQRSIERRAAQFSPGSYAAA